MLAIFDWPVKGFGSAALSRTFGNIAEFSPAVRLSDKFRTMKIAFERSEIFLYQFPDSFVLFPHCGIAIPPGLATLMRLNPGLQWDI
ncbi:MAG TPA: hypothetical protein VFW05_17510 [Verrucomicrobiae bacterium]|nr:hypothetical protein [Verrucomicrobiae bacterium]